MSGTLTAADKLRHWRADPAAMVRELFGVEPDPWQEQVLLEFPRQQRIALKASKGVGKSTVLSWIAWNYLLTRPNPKVAATSVTADNLADGLWTEMALWRGRSPLLMAMFEWTKTRIFSRSTPETWWMSARNWPKGGSADQQANTLAGLHADYILFLIDEAGGTPDAVMASAEAALSSCVEGHLVQAGNPTHLEGPLWRACTSERRLWFVVEISSDPDSPMRAPRVSAAWAREQIEKYGRDNPWVLVNVFGQFPPGSMNTLIGPDEVMAATLRRYRPEDVRKHARVLGVDVARYGDDASVIWPRQGLVALEPIRHRNLDGVQGAGIVARKWADWEADAAFIDDTGGYGASWIDNLRTMGRVPIGVGFATQPSDLRYANKRAEIYFAAAEWIKGGGSLPPMDTPGVSELCAALTRTTYSFRGDRLLLEPKDLVKERLGYSPDDADAFALTFSHPVHPSAPARAGQPRHQVEYDPWRGHA